MSPTSPALRSLRRALSPTLALACAVAATLAPPSATAATEIGRAHV